MISEKIDKDANTFVYVGCRTSKHRNARGKGINVYRVDPASGDWTHVQLVEDLVNPSFFAFDRNKNFLYTVHGDCSDVSAFQIDKDNGQLTFINQQSTGGKNPVHLVVDPTNQFLIVANYISGTMAVLPIHSDGSLGELCDLIPTPDNPRENDVNMYSKQGISHPHHSPLDPTGRFIVVPDLGLNKIFLFTLDTESGKLAPNNQPFASAPEGSGPRHIDFHPSLPYAYVVNELDSTVITYYFDSQKGTLSGKQIISTFSNEDIGNTGAEIMVAPSGRFVYVSIRGNNNSIAIFAVDQETGLLTKVGWESARGETPRFFTFDPSGRFLYVANEDSDTIVKFSVNELTGELMFTGDIINTGSPVCIVFKSDIS
jgi:6-phosphogluconolactonase